MIRLAIHVLVLAILAWAPLLSLAEEARRLPIIGNAIPVDRVTDAPYQAALREGLRQLGYIDGKNMIFVARYANGDPTKLRAIIGELIDLHVDVLVGDARLMKEATSTVPLVSPTMGDPVKTGLVASLARPGGNLTGLSAQSYDIWPKQLELARELFPKLTQVGFLFDTNDEPDALTRASDFASLAQRVGVATTTIPVSSITEIEKALKTIHHKRPQVLIIWSSPLLTQYRAMVIKSVGHQLPVISDGRFYAEAGALLSYSVDWRDLFTRSATYIDKILRGAKPGDLPIEQPTKFELVVNLRTAGALHIKIPQSILVRADKTIQ